METGWLIDNTERYLCIGANGREFEWGPYTSPLALRFARKQDAELLYATIARIAGVKSSAVRAVDHGWY